MLRTHSIRANEITVFIVESSQAQAKFIANQLRAIGIEKIQIFQDGGSALSAMRQQAPELAISSMHHADMSGTALIEKMRAHPELNSIAFILISSEQKQDLLDGIKQAGACAMLPKPFSNEQLSDAIATTLDYLNIGTLEVADETIEAHRLRVLVVDDSSSSRAYISHVLKTLGIKQITLAENGKRAIDIVANQIFDVIITDYNMPEMDGCEFITFMRNKSWQSSVPILMMTSESNQTRLAAVEQAGATAICSKPFIAPAIKAMLEKILSS